MDEGVKGEAREWEGEMVMKRDQPGGEGWRDGETQRVMETVMKREIRGSEE